MSLVRESCLKFSKRRSVSFGGSFTNKYLWELEVLNETSKKWVELSRGMELSSTDESMDDADVEEAQPVLTNGVLCVITTQELDFRSALDFLKIDLVSY